jgi:cytochrome c553
VRLARTLAVVIATGLLAMQAGAQTADAKKPNELATLLGMKGNPARGKEVFEACHDCHRKDASGRANGVFPRLSGQHALVLLKQLDDIRAGQRNNPSMQGLAGGLSRNDLVDVAAFLQSLPISDKNGKGTGTNLKLGKQLYERDCASCHGANGEGDAVKFYPMVAAQHYQYLLREVITVREGTRGNSNPEMVRAVKDYGKADFEAVSDYMSQLPPPKR